VIRFWILVATGLGIFLRLLAGLLAQEQSSSVA
jgi:hypothetical protein